MSIALLDVNALFGLFWKNHVFHARIVRWFSGSENQGWATCPITEQGFARIVSNPASISAAPRVSEAIDLLQKNIEASRNHQFWSDDLPLAALSEKLRLRLTGHKQVTDAYLLALAVHHQGRLVTFDTRISSLAPEGSRERDALVILRP